MEPVKPIPCPPSHRWREFRIRLMPVVTFAIVFLAVVFVWKEHVAPPNIIGEVFPIRAVVQSWQAGTIKKLEVSAFQLVTNGQPIMEVSLSDPELLKAIQDTYEAQADFLEASQEPLIQDKKLTADIARFEVDILKYKIELETAKAQLAQLENEYKRHRTLAGQGVVSLSEFEAKESEYQKQMALISSLEAAIKNLEPTLIGLQEVKVKNREEVMNSSQRVLQQEKNTYLAEKDKIILRAPLDGVISIIHRRPGEAIVAGEPLVTITSLDSDTIIAYVRQPISIQPKKNMAVEVRSRARVGPRQRALATIQHVGAQMEPISTNLLYAVTRNTMPEWGLPLVVSLPKTLAVVPGEIVDITLLPSKD